MLGIITAVILIVAIFFCKTEHFDNYGHIVDWAKDVGIDPTTLKYNQTRHDKHGMLPLDYFYNSLIGFSEL